MRVLIVRYLQTTVVLSALLLAACASKPPVAASNPKIDRISAEELARIIPQSAAKLSLDDLVNLSKQGKTPEQIIDQIKTTDSMYDLTPSQSLALSRSGVDAKVLDFIHERRELALRNNLADEINRREQQKQAEIAKLKTRNWQRQRYNSYCGLGRYGFSPYGYGGFGSRFGSRFGSGFGIGTGIGFPLGCW
ncbi:MAG: hypothetical protein B7Y16_02970 [Methylotenera sp. 24-45-7]|jgi:hypothetical protein|nr:MAG: hypothetical protein B7Y72_00455 [Mehylophilales bacterium 35-46-6]OYZ41229.1 MAG: hypothetical protein B7Y16_02970 [Methylotenera sp. 24-45-7]OZA53876.1 MAG: hypothetical protein B7X73_02865 [Methylophilales bacterium 39-45-7]HQS37028.1 hypothetical protein [Methylotenera sp.]